MTSQSNDTIEVIARESGTRGDSLVNLNLDDFAANVQIFLTKMTKILEQAPNTIGEFQFETIELHAEVTAKGSIALLGTGGEAGATGGLTFVFKRVTSPK